MKRLTAILLLVTLSIGLFGCQSREFQSPVSFYYCRSDPGFAGTDGIIAPETRELAGIEGDPDAILALYFQGPQNRELENLIPDDGTLPIWDRDGDTLHLHFSEALAQLSGVELTLAASCLTRTFLELTGCKTLILTAEGQRLNGETSMVLTLDSLSLRDDIMDRLHGEHTIYYSDPDRRYLIGRNVSIDLTNREELPGLLLELMRTPPAGTELRSLIPADTEIHSVTVEDGLCTLDLSPEFLSRRFYSPTGQMLTLTGIVNTLTNLSGIEQVEFYADGNLLVRYGSLYVSGALSRDERSLGPVRTGLGEREATIYLAHGQENGLIPVSTRLRQTAGVSSEELMMHLLLEDSGVNGFLTHIPEGTVLNGIRLEDQLCHVDLSDAFLNTDDPTWAARVITASLCTLDEISSVQITVNGAVPEGYSPELFGILTPDDTWFL